MKRIEDIEIEIDTEKPRTVREVFFNEGEEEEYDKLTLDVLKGIIKGAGNRISNTKVAKNFLEEVLQVDYDAEMWCKATIFISTMVVFGSRLLEKKKEE